MENVPFLNAAVVEVEPPPMLSPVFDYVLHALQQQSASGNKNLMLQYPPQFTGLFYIYIKLCTPSPLLSSASLTAIQHPPPFLTTPDSAHLPSAGLRGLSPGWGTTSSPPTPPSPSSVAASSPRAGRRHHPRDAADCRCPPLLSSRHGLTVSLPPFFFFLPSSPANERASARLPCCTAPVTPLRN